MKFDVRKWGVAVISTVMSVAAFAQTSGGSSDPTSSIASTLATYATDVGTLGAAVLLIIYGKKLVRYLNV